MLPLRYFLLAMVLPGLAWAESYYWGGQKSLTEIRTTTAEIGGNFGFGSNFWANYRSYMNVNGCPVATWRPCSMSDIRQAYTNRVTGWNTLTSAVWVIGYDVSVVKNYDTVLPTTTNCSQWTNDLSGHGMIFVPPSIVGTTDPGFQLAGCAKERALLCCR